MLRSGSVQKGLALSGGGRCLRENQVVRIPTSSHLGLLPLPARSLAYLAQLVSQPSIPSEMLLILPSLNPPLSFSARDRIQDLSQAKEMLYQDPPPSTPL